MAIEVREIVGAYGQPKVIATLPDFDAAKAYVKSNFSLVCMEDDVDHADCADAYTTAGRVLAIQPVGFSL